ncbi:MAG TPA: metal-dependent hydrolase [Saprospiraceae bacterium]|nr:metal-dependent hydrolase [Saprospiraceae bacterium]HPN69872.1 metal-dependent hydrolase [Saprospiraceae bacterium]
MKLTFLGQSCFLIETMGKKLIIDPMIKSNPLASEIKVEDIKVDYVLLTHGHYDHVADAQQIATNNDAIIISNFEIVGWYEQKGLKGHGMNLGGKFKFDFGMIKYVVGIHSSMLPDGTYGGASGGFVISNDEATIYFAGDTALTMDMQLIPKTCPPLDLAVLPVGDNFTMGYEDAIIASDFIACDQIVGCHFDTFPPIKIDHEVVRKAFKDQNKTIILPQIGQEITV